LCITVQRGERLCIKLRDIGLTQRFKAQFNRGFLIVKTLYKTLGRANRAGLRGVRAV